MGNTGCIPERKIQRLESDGISEHSKRSRIAGGNLASNA
jgi:hypothetical protein